MVGRRPDPAGVKSQKTPVRSTRKAVEAAPVDDVAEGKGRAPAWLKGDGLVMWERIAPKLRAARLLQSTDELAFARYCKNFALWRKLREQLDRRGYTYDATTTTGGKLRRADPNFLIADRLERQLLAVEDRFGMNPSERQRIFAARAAAGTGQLPFGEDRKSDDTAAKPSEPAAPMASAVGFLN